MPAAVERLSSQLLLFQETVNFQHMPRQLELGIVSLMHGLDESMHLYCQTMQGLVDTGKLTKEEAEEQILKYQEQLCKHCSLIDTRPNHLGMDREKRAALQEEFQRVAWRLQLNDNVHADKREADAVVAYLNHKRRQAMSQLESAIKVARSLFSSQAQLRVLDGTFIEMEAVNQITRKTQRLSLPCWYWGQTPVHYDTHLVDEIKRQTTCQATIFQRIPEGFVRIATNIRTVNGRRAVGTFIPLNSKVASSVLRGETYRGSAFVLNNWYLSIYEPIYINGEVQGILYVGREEALELMPRHDLSEEKVEKIFSRLHEAGAFEAGVEDGITEKLIHVLSNLPDNAAHPLINIGLKEVAALLIQGREKQKEQTTQGIQQTTTLDVITRYIQENISEDISIDLLAELSCMSKASFYRYFKSKYNTTPNVFINRERLRQAYQLMEQDPELSVRAICREVGFNSTSHFIKLFRKHYGLTPKQYQLQREKQKVRLNQQQLAAVNT